MMGPLQNAMRLQALRAAANSISIRTGTVTSYNPKRYAAKVTLQPDGLQTGWLPIASMWIGNGWGLFTPPNIGDQVLVEFINGDMGAGTVGGRIWDNNQQPLSVPSGECWLYHAKGGYFKLTNDGKVTFSDGQGAMIALNGDGTITSAGTWNHTGSFTATVDVVGGGKSLKNHTHGGVTTGGGNTGPPN